MSVVDITIGVLLLIGAYQGYREGFLMTVVTLVAIILGVLGGFKLMGYAMVVVTQRFDIDEHVVPYMAFGLVFILIVLVVSLLGRIVKAIFDKTFFGGVDQALGAFAGIAKGLFMLSIVLWIFHSLSFEFPESWTENSWLYPITADFAPKITIWISKLIPAFRDIF